jgi:hypothetical protein
MGHYKEQYERQYEAEKQRKEKEIERLKKIFPEEYEKAMRFKELVDAYEIFSRYF